MVHLLHRYGVDAPGQYDKNVTKLNKKNST